MKIITKASLISSMADRYKQTYNTDKNAGQALFGMRLMHKEHYELLRVATTEDAIGEVMGNRSWTKNKCDECGQDYDVTVQLGEEPDYESATAQICLGCLNKAVELIGVM